MDVTLEQARVFESVARLGTVQKAAEELHRGHSAVLYSLKSLEEQTRLRLFDRSGHRNRITEDGRTVLKYCLRLLEVRHELAVACDQIRGGWEPSLKLIYDEVVDFHPIGRALFQLNEMNPPTEVKVLAAHLDQVEALFLAERADLMMTILPFEGLRIPSQTLRPIRMHLVAHRDHALCKKGRSRLTPADLNHHTHVTIRITPGNVGLSTEKISFDSYFLVNSFQSKKIALMSRLGFGWLPDYLISDELRKGVLQELKTTIASRVSVRPRLYHRPEEQMGKATQKLLRFLAGTGMT